MTEDSAHLYFKQKTHRTGQQLWSPIEYFVLKPSKTFYLVEAVQPSHSRLQRQDQLPDLL